MFLAADHTTFNLKCFDFLYDYLHCGEKKIRHCNLAKAYIYCNNKGDTWVAKNTLPLQPCLQIPVTYSFRYSQTSVLSWHNMKNKHKK